MRSRSIQDYCAAWLRCGLVVLAIGFCGRAAWGSSDVRIPGQPNSEVVDKSAETLPDAPSALRSDGPQSASGAPHVPLEQQEHPEVTVKHAPISVLRDGVNMVASPAYIRTGDLKWLLPLAGAATAAFATDTKTMTEVVSSNPSFNQTSVNVSNGLVWGLIATPVTMFGVGHLRHDERARETGILGSEAMVDAVVADELVKLCAFRERPYVDHGQGEFFVRSAGANSSFISEHSMIAWSSAAVIAGEYHSKWAQIAVYTAATGVSLTRVLGQEHFPSDVLFGATGGWLIGHYVLRAHHHLPLEHAGK